MGQSRGSNARRNHWNCACFGSADFWHTTSEGSRDIRVDATLIKAIVRGRQWFEQLATGQLRLFSEIAEAEGVTGRYVAHLVPLAFLAPDIVARILSGTQPVEITTEMLTKRIDLPLAWAEQRALLGFD